MTGAYRHAHEASDPIFQDHLTGSGQEVGGLGDVIEVSAPPGQRHASDQPVPQPQDPVDLAEPAGKPAIAPQQELAALYGDEVQTGGQCLCD